MAGQDAGDPSSVDAGFEWAGPPDPALVRRRQWRIAVPKGVTEKAQPAVTKNFEKALAALGDTAVITRDVEWPDFPWGPAVGTIVGAEGASAFLDLIESGGLKKLPCPRDRWAGYNGTAVSADDYLQAMRLRGPMSEAVNALDETYAAIGWPTRPAVALPADAECRQPAPGAD